MKIKLLIIFFCFWNLISVTLAQDIIIKMNGDEIKAKVTEVNKKEINYQEFEDESGRIWSLSTSDIFMIKYENGTKDVFGITNPAVQYQDKSPAVAFGLSLVFPGLGQFYNGQKSKGIIMCALAAGAYVTSYSTRYSSSASARELKSYSWLVICGTYIWSLADASISAQAINRRNQVLSWNLDNNRHLSVTPDVLFSNTLGTKTNYHAPAYGFSMKLDF